jgi:hypothetical protein
MRKSGGRTCMMFASTPGDLETSTGKAAQRIIDRTPPFTEKLYDLNDKQFEEFLEGSTNIDEHGNPVKVSTVYIEYNYKQLRQTEEWVREQHNEAVRNNKMAEYRRGILLERFRGGTDGSLFLQADVDYIKAHVRQPDKEILLLNKYLLYVYDHQIRNIDLNSDTPYFDIDIPYMVGIDISGGTGGDNTTFVVVHPYTFQVVAELASPYIGGLDLIRCVIQLAKLMPKAVFCPETNTVGKPMLEWIQDSHLEYRFYCDPKLDITKNVTMDQDDLEAKLKHKALLRKYIGTNVTPKIRNDMMTLLKRYVHDYRHLINTKLLVKDIDSLTINKGKIEAEYGEHDDVVMAYNHVLYVFTYGYDLTRYGINKKLCSFEKAYQEVKQFDHDQEMEVVDNMKPYGPGAYGYEEQLLRDIVNANEDAGFDRQTGMDQYGYKTNQYNQIQTQQMDDVLHATHADISFFSSVQNF